MKYLFLILFIPNICLASWDKYDVHVTDSPIFKSKIVITIIDICGYQHKLLLPKKYITSDKHLKWLDVLDKKQYLDKCLQK